MNNELRAKPPVWFWVVSLIALIWNIMGVYAYLSQAYMTDEARAALPEAQRTILETVPAWTTGAFAVGVFAGFLGCVGLLLRKKWARPVFIISLLGVLVQNSYYLFLSDTIEVMGTQAFVMPIVVILILLALLYFTKLGIQRRWLT